MHLYYVFYCFLVYFVHNVFVSKIVTENIMNNGVMGLQHIQNSEKTNHTLIHQDLAITLMDTLGHIFANFMFS